MGAMVKKNFIYFLSLLFNQWLMISCAQDFNLIYSSIFVLLDKTIVDVAKDGIHFFDAQLNIENTSHFVKFTDPLESIEVASRTSFSQFSQKYDEYILILCRRIIYIFDKQHNLKSNFSLDDSIQDIYGKSKYIIAYKKINESLHYLIRYSDSNSHHILHYEFNLSSSNVENTTENPIDTININVGEFSISVYCSFMSSTNINHDILSCFYVSAKNNNIKLMNSVSYDPENNFNEIDSLRYNITVNFWESDHKYFEGITNEKKDKVLFYFFHQNSFWGTFDYTNHFSDFVSINGSNDFLREYYGHKLFYFRETKEFIIFSSFNNCTKFIMVFHSNLAIHYKGFLDNRINCWQPGPNNIFYNGNNYTIIYEDNRARANSYGAEKIPINELSLIIVEQSNPSTISYNKETNIITDKITTTEPTIITTEPTIITTEPTIITTEPTIITTEPTIITTEPTIITTEPTIITTEPTIITTEPTITTTEPTIITTEPTIITTEPTIITTEPTIITTEPTIITTEPTIITTEPTIITTEPTIIITEPTIITTEPTIITTEPTIITTEPTITTTEPTIIATEPIISTANIMESTFITAETEIKNS